MNKVNELENKVQNMGNWEATNELLKFEEKEYVEELFNNAKWITIKVLLYKNLKESK